MYLMQQWKYFEINSSMIKKKSLNKHWTNFSFKGGKGRHDHLSKWGLGFSKHSGEQTEKNCKEKLNGIWMVLGGNVVCKERQCFATKAWKGDSAMQSTMSCPRVHWAQCTMKKIAV